MASQTPSDLGVRLAGPFLAVGFVIYLGLGFLSRMMPQIQIFFIALPINIIVGLSLLLLLIGGIMSVFLGALEAHLSLFLS